MELRLRERTNARWQNGAVSNPIDEHSRECLLIHPEQRWSSAKVIEALADVMVSNGVP